MSTIAGNQRRNPFTLGRIAQSVGDYFTRIKRYDEAREEYHEAMMAYNSVLQKSPHFASAQNQKGIIQKILDDLSVKKVPILPQRTVVNDLSRWLQNHFTQAIEAGWLTLEEIWDSNAFRKLAFRNQAVKRAKQINLGTDRVALVIELDESENQEVSVIMRVHPISIQSRLPDNLKFSVIPESGKPDDFLIKNHRPGSFFKTAEWFFKHGERFTIKMQLNNVIVTEDFVI